MLVAIGTDFIVNVNHITMRQPLFYNEIMHNFSDENSSYDRLIIVDTSQNYFYNTMFFSLFFTAVIICWFTPRLSNLTDQKHG